MDVIYQLIAACMTGFGSLLLAWGLLEWGTGGGYQIDGDIFADGGRCIVCGTGMYITSAEGTEGGLHRRNVILAYLLRLY